MEDTRRQTHRITPQIIDISQIEVGEMFQPWHSDKLYIRGENRPDGMIVGINVVTRGDVITFDPFIPDQFVHPGTAHVAFDPIYDMPVKG